MSESLTLLEAWSRWRHGQSVVDATLWGLRILWLGRAGKFLEFLGAATIISDIIGPVKIRAFGSRLVAFMNVRTFKHGIRGARVRLEHALRLFRFGGPPPNLKKKSEIDARKEKTFADLRHPILIFELLITIAIAYIVSWVIPVVLWARILLFLVALFVGAVIAPIISNVTILLLRGLVLILDFLLIQSWASFLAQPKLELWIKIIAVLLTAVGFHFDWLAS